MQGPYTMLGGTLLIRNLPCGSAAFLVGSLEVVKEYRETLRQLEETGKEWFETRQTMCVIFWVGLVTDCNHFKNFNGKKNVLWLVT